MAEWGGHRRRALDPGGPTRSGAPTRIVLLVVLVLAVVSVLSFPSVGAAGPAPTTLRAAVLTPDGNDGYSIDGSPDALTVTANPGNTGGNLRTLVWPESAPPARDETVCATWQQASSHLVQEGVALRIAPRRDGTFAAVTVTKNIYAGAEWWFNVHVWHGPGLGDQIAQFDLHRVFQTAARAGEVVRQLPWRICARTRGDRLQMVVWPLDGPAPRWGAPGYGGSTELPATAPRTGVAGWYAGHVRPGMSVEYTGLHGAEPAEAEAGLAATGGRVGAVALTG
jgi:hypothetical protein